MQFIFFKPLTGILCEQQAVNKRTSVWQEIPPNPRMEDCRPYLGGVCQSHATIQHLHFPLSKMHESYVTQILLVSIFETNYYFRKLYIPDPSRLVHNTQ